MEGEGEGEGRELFSSLEVLGGMTRDEEEVLKRVAEDFLLIPNHLVNQPELIFLLICSSINAEMTSLSGACPKKIKEQITGSTTAQG